VLVVNVWLDAPPFGASAFPARAARGLVRPPARAAAPLRLDLAQPAPLPARFVAAGAAPRVALAACGPGDERRSRSSGVVDAVVPAEVLQGSAEFSALELTFAVGAHVRIGD